MRDVHEARLLIVDDEPELRRMLVSILRGDGYADVHEAATAAEALEKALRLYQGRAFWDGLGDMDPEFLDKMSRRYGLAIL